MKRSEKVKLSVIVPVWNSQKVLSRSLESIKHASFAHYELIVVDDASTDDSSKIAKQYANTLIKLPTNKGRAVARQIGFQKGIGEIIVNIDSDVSIKKDTLKTIHSYFSEHSEVAAITGRLGKKCVYKNFPSCYKNLYMHYYFGILPLEVSFLYGSIFAIRKEVYKKTIHNSPVPVTDDTSLGQALFQSGNKIHLLKNLEVTHMKYFNMLTLVKNDFTISRDWMSLFLRNKGWTQLFKKKTGYAHASRGQILSIWVASLFGPAVFLFLVSPLVSISTVCLLFIIFLYLNFSFFVFLSKKGTLFLFQSFVWTFVNYFVMLSGICYGAATFFFKKTLKF